MELLPYSFFLKKQPGACSSYLRRVWWRVQSFWVLCKQPFIAFLQETVFRTWTHGLMVIRQQLYRCVRAPLQLLPYSCCSKFVCQLGILRFITNDLMGIDGSFCRTRLEHIIFYGGNTGFVCGGIAYCYIIDHAKIYACRMFWSRLLANWWTTIHFISVTLSQYRCTLYCAYLPGS
jgi:hypothetical protein